MNVIDRVLGLLAPHQCVACGKEGSPLCTRCLLVAGNPPPERCVGCHKLSKGYKTCDSCKTWLPIEAVYVSNPLEGVYAEMIRSFKFDCKRQVSVPLARLMTEVFQGEAHVLLCPVPTAPSRIRERGFDHTKLLAREYKGLARSLPLEITYSLRRRSNVRQLGSGRAKRIEQMKQEFYIADSESIKNKDILLLDDVVTTGASLAAAAKTLKQAGARRITAVTFAQKV